MIGQDEAAFPKGPSDGLTAREYAAIQLRCPDSGTDWLDKMIRCARHLDFMSAACGRCSEYRRAEDANIQKPMCRNARHVHEMADAVMRIHFGDTWGG